MPNGYHHDPKEYGEHSYEEHGTSNCAYECGCWMGPTRSGGPTGLSPSGTCPKNPKDGKLLSEDGGADYDYVVTERIRSLENRLYEAEGCLRRVSPSKVKLGKELTRVKAELAEKDRLLTEIHRLLSTRKQAT